MPSNHSDGPDGADSGASDGQPADPAAANPYVDGRAMANRTADAGPLFGDQFRPGESGIDAGLIAGEPTDPILVAGVSYPLLGDLAVGTVVAYRVAEWDLPGVAVADCSHTPVAAYQTISNGDHDAVVLVGAEKRGGELNDGTPSESPGAIHEYDVHEYDVPDEQVVERIGESAMGSNTVENVLVVAKTLEGLPDDGWVVTIEPGYDSWGTNVDEFTDPVAEAVDDIYDRVLDRIETAGL